MFSYFIPTVTIPGFRKGKAPLNLVKKKYENNVLNEVVEKIVQDKTRQLLEEKKLKVFRQPKVEIKNYKKNETVKLSIKIDHFSYSFGNISFFSKKALNIAKSHFQFVHTGMRGNNFKRMNSWAIRRDAIDMKDSLNLMGSFLEGVADFRYVSSLEKYESWASDPK